MTGGFQSQVQVQPAPGVEGDFASKNPYASYDAGPGGLVAGPGGLAVGRFCWTYPPVDPNGTNQVAMNTGAGPVAGFVKRSMQALITGFLQDSTLIIPPGFMAGDVMVSGDFWVRNSGAAQALPGMKAYANLLTGVATFAVTGNPAAGGTSTASTIAATTGTFTGSILGDVLTVTSAPTNPLALGSVLSGTNVPTGLTVLEQTGGTRQGQGTYLVSIGELNIAAETITAAYGLLMIGGTVAGTFAVDDVLTGTNVTAGSTITDVGTGTGGAGTYYTQSQTTASTAINVSATNVETKWYARSIGLQGELVKISSYPIG